MPTAPSGRPLRARRRSAGEHTHRTSGDDEVPVSVVPLGHGLVELQMARAASPLPAAALFRGWGEHVAGADGPVVLVMLFRVQPDTTSPSFIGGRTRR